jgi:hypothetical protein
MALGQLMLRDTLSVDYRYLNNFPLPDLSRLLETIEQPPKWPKHGRLLPSSVGPKSLSVSE